MKQDHDLPPAHSETIQHDLHVGHFKCSCGRRLKFSADPGGVATVMKDRLVEAGRRGGVCPFCGARHEAGPKLDPDRKTVSE